MNKLLYIVGSILVVGVCGILFLIGTSVPEGLAVYENRELRYSIQYPVEWSVDKTGLVQGISREVRINPPDVEDFITYISISLDSRSLEQIRAVFKVDSGEWEERTSRIDGRDAYVFVSTSTDTEYLFIPYNGHMYLVATDRASDTQVLDAVASFRFISWF